MCGALRTHTEEWMGFGFYDSNSKELAKKLIFSLFLIVSSFLDCSFLGNI